MDFNYYRSVIVLAFLLSVSGGILLCPQRALAQNNVGIGITNTELNPHAVLHLHSNNQGLLVPRLTMDQRDALTSSIQRTPTPASSNGLLIFYLGDNHFYYWHSPDWVKLGSGTSGSNLLSDAKDPELKDGVLGDFYIQITDAEKKIFGPKTATGWGKGTSLIGPKGDRGDPGNQGPAGIQGAIGPPGPQGLQGVAGPQGPTGDRGPQGIRGETGPPGPQGLQGEVGPQGPAGPQGIQGPQGLQGVAGPQGTAGDKGADGKDGAPGKDGKTILSGSEDPSTKLGAEGDFYIQTTTTGKKIFGPKVDDKWGSGTPLTGTGNVTGVAGGDLTGNFPDPTIKAFAVTGDKLANNAVTSDKIFNGAVNSDKLTNGAVTTQKISRGGNSTILSTDATGNVEWESKSNYLLSTTSAVGMLSGTFPNLSINNNQITTAMLQDGQVTEPKLATGAVTRDKLENGVVNSDKLANEAVSSDKLAAGAVTIDKLADKAINLAGPKADGILPVSRGGSGVGSLTGILLGNGSAPFSTITPGSAGQFLRRNAGNGYEFVALPPAEVPLTFNNGLTRIENDIRLGGRITMNTELNLIGNSTLNFQSEGSSALFITPGTTISPGKKVGISQSAPIYTLDVNGTIRSGSDGTKGEIRIGSGSDGHEVSLSPRDKMEESTHYKLPANLGENGQVLMTHGDGNLSWSPKTSSSPSTKYLSVDPTAFVRIGTSVDNIYYDGENANFVSISSNTPGYIGAALNLPDGATIKKVTFYYFDNDNSNMSFSLQRKYRNSDDRDIVASTNLSVKSVSAQETAPAIASAFAKVENSAYTYKIIVRLKGHNNSAQIKQHLYSVVVEYVE